MPPAAIPIAILAFDRPHYLEPFLASLVAQAELDPGRADIHLFLDGAVNRHSRRTHAAEADIDRCEALFRAAFPKGRVLRAAHNLGTWGNFDRAEHHVFETLGAEVAYFFEDDLVLSPHYLRVMDGLWDQVRGRDDISHFAAYGNHLAGLEEQHARERDLVTLQHHWGFGLKRDHWRRMRDLLAPCGELLREVDYRQRPVAALQAWLRAQGVPAAGTSQDHLKAAAATLLGFWRLSTFACWGRYIGETGLHYSPELYRQRGFHRTALFPRSVTGFALPPPAGTALLVRQQLAIYRGETPPLA
jgi:hypothetical protein